MIIIMTVIYLCKKPSFFTLSFLIIEHNNSDVTNVNDLVRV